ncbi:hypothetical protein NQ176_g5407 [Zarea fungicola]|uniref:Uncharacterized protein n=1 Tax=Zarea fungicola TaxID=93591 RepID=A0ACC1NAJ0_9HYPO|nr:hypothetical protein NQ176_g5407 [Lecanicillium fungicola]
MSKEEIEDLKRLLKESRAREEEAKTQEKKERREKEKERREKEEAKAREGEERRRTHKTTLDEYLYKCHFDLYQKLRLASSSKSSTGLATSVDSKYYTKWLRPGRDFTENKRQDHFNDIIRICGERRPFQLAITTREIGASFERKKAGYENAIDHFEKPTVEDPTWNILEPIWTDENLRQKYQITDLSFTKGIRQFNDLNEDVETKVRTGRGKQKPDGGDYKAAHKFAVEHLEVALAEETLFMDVHKIVYGLEVRFPVVLFSMAFPFGFLCKLLERLEKIPGGSSDTVIITTWFNERSSVIPRQEPGAIAFLPCLFPEQRPDRVFGLQERQLESIIQHAQCLGPSRVQQLQLLKASDHLDFAASVQRVMAIIDCEPRIGSEPALEEIDDTLDQRNMVACTLQTSYSHNYSRD